MGDVDRDIAAETDEGDDDRFPLLTLGETLWGAVVVAIVFGVGGLVARNLWNWINSSASFEWMFRPFSSYYFWVGAISLVLMGGVAGSNTQRLWVSDGGWSPRVVARACICALMLTSGFGLMAILLINRYAET